MQIKISKERARVDAGKEKPRRQQEEEALKGNQTQKKTGPLLSDGDYRYIILVCI